ncbi:MAG: cytochrome ubiquinol oxidase subunit I [Gammaproteobacteria bacterium]|nr:cytochrome ubiquinol oxidase subunit I [Gammaproteobacteria bacterium]
MSALLLSRLQFALTISFHIIFPAFSIGLASYLVLIEGLWLKTRQKIYYRTARYFSKILALTFGMGIISGLAMAFQMGTNWAGFSKTVGPVLGVLFTLESLTAFFVEATFLGLMLFGWHLVSKRLHYFSTIMVCFGVNLSAFWIMAANSWMHTPSGVVFENGHFIVNNWLLVVFNPSALPRFTHMIIASYIATLMVIAMIAAFNLLRNRFQYFALKNLKLALFFLAIFTPLQIIVGDVVGLKIHHYQPIKTAAIEGLWETKNGAPLVLFANISQQERKNTYSVEIPKLASLINTHHLNGRLIGLNTVVRHELPRVAVVFYSFRVMVGLGFLMLMLSFLGLYYWRKNALTSSYWYHRLLIICAPSGFIALLTGWFTSEVGRQPWVVYGLVKTHDVVSQVSPTQVLNGFIVIIMTYGLIFGIGYLSFFVKMIKKGPVIKSRKLAKILAQLEAHDD